MWPFIITQCVIGTAAIYETATMGSRPPRSDENKENEDTRGAPVVPLCSRRVLAGITY
jgi:hypothetical protein